MKIALLASPSPRPLPQFGGEGRVRGYFLSNLFGQFNYFLKVGTHGLTPVALAAEDYYVISDGFRTLRLPRKERFHLQADARSPQRLY